MIERETREEYMRRWTWFLERHLYPWLRSTGEKRISLRSLATALGENFGTLASWGREGKIPERARFERIAQKAKIPEPERMALWLVTGLGEPPGPATLDDALDPRRAPTVRVGHRRARRPFAQNVEDAHAQLADVVAAGGVIDLRVLKAFTALADAVEDLPRVKVASQGSGDEWISSTPTSTWNDRRGVLIRLGSCEAELLQTG